MIVDSISFEMADKFYEIGTCCVFHNGLIYLEREECQD